MITLDGCSVVIENLVVKGQLVLNVNQDIETATWVHGVTISDASFRGVEHGRD